MWVLCLLAAVKTSLLRGRSMECVCTGWLFENLLLASVRMSLV